VLVVASTARLGITTALTAAGLVTMTLPVIAAVGFYLMLRALGRRPRN
jgi:uncharacterized membrane protein